MRKKQAFLIIFTLLLLTALLVGCGPDAAQTEEPEAAQALSEADYAAVDAFLSDCIEKFENGEYEQLESNGNYFPYGEQFMFVIVDKTRGEPEFVRSSEETIAYVPEPIGAESLCWDPTECDTVFYLYSETDDKPDRTYDNGTKGYDTWSVLCVIDPKAGTVWGPESIFCNPPPYKVTGSGVGHDSYAQFDYKGGLHHIYWYSELPLHTFITYPNRGDEFFILDCERYVFRDGYEAYREEWETSGLTLREYCEKVLYAPLDYPCRRTEWRDLDGLVLTGADGATLTIHADKQEQYAYASYSGSLGTFDCNLHVLTDTAVEFGEVYNCFAR